MLEGIDQNQIIVGAYTDGNGGVCPMLAAHRNGGRTDLASFARAWDAYTIGPEGSRPATKREIRTLRAMLEASLWTDGRPQDLAAAVEEHRAAQVERALREEHEPRRADTAWAWLRRRNAAPPAEPERSERELDEAGVYAFPYSPSPGRMNWISGTMQCGEVRSRKRTPSAMSSGWIISSFGTSPSPQSVIGVATKPGQRAVTCMPASESSLWAAWLRPTTANFVAE